MAHKKAAWSAKNLRDSKPKYRWVKVFWWQNVLAWNIILRQKWTKYQVGKNTYMWKDFSIHAAIDGIVEFSKANISKFDGRKYLKTFVNVVPVDTVEKKETKKEITKVAQKAPKKEEIKKEEVKKKEVKKEEVKKELKEKPVTKKETAKKPTATKKTTSSTDKKATAPKAVSTKKETTTKKSK